MEHLTKLFISFASLHNAPEGRFCIAVLNMLQKMPNLQLFEIMPDFRDEYGQIYEIICRATVLATSREKKVCIRMYERLECHWGKKHVEMHVLNVERKDNHDGVTKYLESETFNITWSGLNGSVHEDLNNYLKQNLKVGAYAFHSYKKAPFLRIE